MTTYASANPYELWTSRRLLGVFRQNRPETWAFGRYFTNQMRSTEEWIDFEKLPIRSRSLAPFVKPKGEGHGVFTDRVQGYRFKPANIVVQDAVDELRPLTQQPGIDYSMLSLGTLTPMQRIALIKMAMAAEFQLAVERRWEWMKARAIIDGKVTCVYRDGTSVEVDFQRASGHTEVLSSGNRWGDSGVSIYSKFQSVMDTMNNAAFGGTMVHAEMGQGVANVLLADTEIKAKMEQYHPVPGVNVERGLINGSGEKRYSIGSFTVGGNSGQRIELWVNNETYTADNGSAARYLGTNEIVFTSTPEAINGYECFGMIVDKDAEYQALPMFPKNFVTGERVKTEHISIESAPLFVPINPDATYKLTPIA
ncbi:major capsid protein [Sphingobium lignivorans]|uniref:Major capsid protein n=1 Tax=Sphingobium lignivorans TaxID=2735886 RepID=A0ABR6NH20_9SPHN|nr:major capsid protein [Sphingobium lignivorans]MBB5985927.1 hypothetical protein [Sphingobium lignivorans]